MGSDSMLEVLFATNNRNKLREVQILLPSDIKLVTLKEAGVDIELPEPFETLEDNARSKIEAIHQHTGISAGFSEDSGLFINALEGRPGVHSAHYAGPQRSDADNIRRVLEEMEGQTDRSAFFQTTICLLLEDKTMFFTGTCDGEITLSPIGTGGFGYDPIFRPAGSTRTFGEMSLEEKNEFSHRKKAVGKLVNFFHRSKNIG